MLHSLLLREYYVLPTSLEIHKNMQLFIVWEIYSPDWKLIKKGSDFKFLPDLMTMDVEIEEWGDKKAKSLGIKREFFVIASIQLFEIPEGN